jgi:hypothetical protein
LRVQVARLPLASAACESTEVQQPRECRGAPDHHASQQEQLRGRVGVEVCQTR